MTEPTTLLPISIDLLDPAEDNPRTDLGDLAGLASSIMEVGILEPIMVTPGEYGRYTIIAGHRRHAAARLVNLTEVEVIVQAVDSDADRQRMMLIENLHREDLSVLDKARGFKALADAGLSQRDIAGQVGVSQATVSKHMSLLKLPEEVQQWVVDQRLSQEDATRIAGLPADARAKLVRDGVPRGWMIEQAVRKAEGEKRYAAKLKELQAKGVTLLEDRAQAFLDDGDTGPAAVSDYGDLSHVDAVEHAGLDCHAVWLAPDGTVYPACTKPVNHPAPEPEEDDGEVIVREVETPEAKAERIANERLVAELADATHRRRSWLRSVSSPAPMALASVKLLTRFAEAGLDYELVMELLDLPAIEGFAHDERIASLVESASKSMPHRVLFLSFAAMGEQAFAVPTWWSKTHGFAADEYEREDGVFYLEVLTELGYETSWIEAKFLGLPYEEGASDADELTSAGTDFSTADEGTESVPDESGPVVTIEPKKGGFMIKCSACGLLGKQTTTELADGRAQDHMRDEHGVAA